MARIAHDGYSGAADPRGQVGAAFMPAMPVTMAAAERARPQPVLGRTCTCQHRGRGRNGRARPRRGEAHKRSRSWPAHLRPDSAFPTAFFFSAPYNEAFGLLFTSLALSAWLVHKTGRAALFAALGSLARMTGVALGVAVLASWLFDDRTRPGLKRAAIVAAGSFGGLFLFWAYLGWAVGDPFASLKSHAAWGRHGLAVGNLWKTIESIYDPALPHWGEAFLALAAALLGIRAWRRRGAFWGVLTLVPVAQMMLSGTFLSGHRVVLACLPAFIELADLLKNRVYLGVVVVGFALTQFVLLNRYVHWLFAG